MPAKLSKPARRRVRELYLQGWKKSAIAKELGISRDTVAKYCNGLDTEVDLIGSPAAQMTGEEVRRLRVLAGGIELTACDGEKGCGRVFAVLPVAPADRRQRLAWYCPGCGTRWLVSAPGVSIG